MLALVATTCLFALFSAFVFVPLEQVAPKQPSQRTQFLADVGWATLGSSFAHVGVWWTAPLLLGWVAAHRPGPWLLDLPVWLSLPLGLIVLDLTSYATHRASHAIPVLRSMHELHHSSEDLDFLAAFRQHPAEVIWTTLAQNLPLVLLGLPLHEHAAVLVLLRVHAVFIHANLDVPVWVSTFIVTPQLHHRHHEHERPVYFAHLFPWIDRAFGTCSR